MTTSHVNNGRLEKLIFIVDDDEDVLFAVNYWFTKNNFLPITYSDSRTMICALKSLKPDLILLDVNLRNEDGRKVCRYLKEKESIQAPVILFSSYSFPGYNFRDDFADGFLEKDQDYYHLAKSLDSLFDLSSSAV